MSKAVAVGAGVGVVVLVVAAYGGATAWAGQRTEVRYQEQMAKAQAKYPFIKISDQHYERSFFGATSTMTFQLGCPSADGKPAPTLTVVDTIHHGPVAGGTIAGAVIDSQVNLGGEPGQKALAMFGGAPITAHTVVSFSGAYASTVRSPAAKITLPDGTELAWQGLTGTVDGAADLQSVSYHLKSPGVTVSDAKQGAVMTMAGLEIDADAKAVPGAGMLTVGKAHGGLDSFELKVPVPASDAASSPPFSMSLNGLKFTNETSITGDLLSGGATITGTGTVGDAKLEHLTMQASMKRIHAPTYQHLMEGFANANPGCGAAKVDPAAMLAKMQTDVLALLQYNPEFSLDKLAFDYAGQHGELAYSVGVQGVTPADAQQPLPLLMMAHGQAKASMSVPVAWIRKVAQASSERMKGVAPDPSMVDVMIDQAAAQGYVVREGDLVKSNVSFAAGKATINGKEIPLGGPPR